MPAAAPFVPRLTLLTGPPGSGKSEAVLARIREAATAAGPRGRGAALRASALLVLPTYGALQHTLRTALTRWDARGLVDSAFATFTSAGERFLPGFRVHSLPSFEERDRLLLAALERADPPVYRAVRGTRGLRARLLHLLKEVKQGAEPPALAYENLRSRAARLAGPARERLEGFLAVAAAYDAALHGAGLEDHEDALHRLLDGLRRSGPGWTPLLLAVDGFDDMTPVEEALLEALLHRTHAAGGETLVALPEDPRRPDLFASGAGLRARLRAAGCREVTLTGFPRAPGGALEQLAARLFAPQPAPLPVSAGKDGEDVVLWAALDPDDEADLVAREVRLLLEGAGRPGAPVRSARDVVVVVPDLERRAARFEEALARLGVPVAHGVPRSLAAEPWTRAVAGVLPLLAGRLGAGEVDAPALLATLRYRALTGDARVAPVAVDAQELRWREDGFPSSWGAVRATVHEALAAPLTHLGEAIAALAAAPAGAGGAVALLAALDDLVPVPAPAGLSAEGRPTDPGHDLGVSRALAARRRLVGLLTDRVAAAERVGAAPRAREAAADLLAALADTAYAVPERRLDVVHLLDPESARSWEAAVVFVAGLDAETLPRRPGEDPLLSDEDRVRLAGDDGSALPTSAVHHAREQRRLLSLLTRARRRLVLVHATRTADGEALPASPLLGEVAAVLALVERREPPGPAPGVVSVERARTRGDLVRLAAAGLRPRSAPAERALSAVLAARLCGDLPRRAARWRRHRADPLPAAALERCRQAVERMSPSRLNAALACPQQHFLARVAGIPPDDLSLRGPRFAASDLGRLLHEALRLALLHPGEDAERVAEEALGGAQYVGVTRRAVLLEVARAVRLFRDREAATRGPLVPLPDWLERPLGGGAGVEVGTGPGRFRLEGRIDRLDVAGRRALVVDYKLGSATADRQAQAAQAGDDLQLLLYALAVEREADLEVQGLEWISARQRARVQWASEAAQDLLAPRNEGAAPRWVPAEEFRARLEAVETWAADLVARLRTGWSPLEPRDEDACAWCPVQGVCRPDRGALRRERAARAAAVPTPEADA